MKEEVYLLGNDNDYVIENNKVTISFEGRWVEFGGKLLCCTILDNYGDLTIYQAPIMVNDDDAILLFSYDTLTHKTDIIGVTFLNDDYGRVYSLNEGDSVLVVKCKYNEDSYQNIYLDSNEFEYTGQSVNVVTLPDGYYQYTAFVKDIYGNTYTAGTAVVEIKDGVMQMLYTVNDDVVYPPVD
jgi:hypothetical protein